MDMLPLGHSIKTTHNLEAVLLLSIGEIIPIIDKVILMIDPSGEMGDFIKTGISNVISTNFEYTMPETTYLDILFMYLLDSYKINITHNDVNSKLINGYMKTIIDLISKKVFAIANKKGYSGIGYHDYKSDDTEIFVVTRVELTNFKLIEFSFYRKNN